MNRLELLRSDLRDCRDPRVQARHPHLASPALIAELERKIQQLETQS